MSYQKCPVCHGVGFVSGGYFGRAGDYDQWGPSGTSECCRACWGTGLINERTGLPPSVSVKKVKDA